MLTPNWTVADTNAYLAHRSSLFATLADLQTATLNARIRTGDTAIAVAVKDGKFQVQRVTYPDRKRSKIEPVSEWLGLTDVVKHLDGLGCAS